MNGLLLWAGQNTIAAFLLAILVYGVTRGVVPSADRASAVAVGSSQACGPTDGADHLAGGAAW